MDRERSQVLEDELTVRASFISGTSVPFIPLFLSYRLLLFIYTYRRSCFILLSLLLFLCFSLSPSLHISMLLCSLVFTLELSKSKSVKFH